MLKMSNKTKAKQAKNPQAPAKLKRFDSTAHIKAFLGNYLEQKDNPGWFRGASTFQIDAAVSLAVALRDDAEQDSTHRTYDCLKRLGVSPMITVRAVRTLMRLSRINDLAFLWFLLEMYYKTPDEGSYSVNEQIIMSAIAYLDLMPTLSELDRLLPPPLPKPPKAKPQQCKIPGPQPRKLKRPQGPAYMANSPYYQSIPRLCTYGKTLMLKRPEFKVSIPKRATKDHLKRWYGTYELQTGRRIVKNVLREETYKVPNLCDDCPEIFRLRSSREAELLLESEIGEVTKTPRDVQSRPEILCEHHKLQREAEAKLQNEMAVAARDRCLRLVDVEGRRREATRQRVLERLEKDIEVYMCRYRQMRAAAEKVIPVRLLRRGGCEQCLLEVADEDSCDSEFRQCPRPTGGEEEEEEGEEKPAGKCPEEPTRSRPKTKTLRFSCPREPGVFLCYDGKQSGNGVCPESDEEDGEDDPQPTTTPNDAIADGYCKINGNYFSCHGGPQAHYRSSSEIHPSEQFFHAPSPNLAARFDLAKIFKMPEANGGGVDIKETFVEALDPAALAEATRTNVPAQVAKACSNMVMQLWRENVEAKIAEMTELEKQVRKSQLEPKYLFPEGDYKPSNKALMDRMLKDGMAEIRKDHHFVLASMPDCHKLQVLREWIYLRYGKTYSQKEIYREYTAALRVFFALRRVNASSVPMPSLGVMATNHHLDYSCREFISKLGDKLKSQHTNALNHAVLDQSRLFWFVLRAYLWPRGPPRSIFYAYMPARVEDIVRFRVWKSGEFRNAKGEWDKRRTKEAQQLRYY